MGALKLTVPVLVRVPSFKVLPPLTVAVPLALSARFNGAPAPPPTGALMAIVAAVNVSVVAGAGDGAGALPTAEEIVMALVAASVTLELFSAFDNAVAVIWLVSPGNVAGLDNWFALVRLMSSPSALSPLKSATVPTVMLAGSSNNVPCLPRRALMSAVPSKYSTCLPDVSPEPPLPPCSPPRALKCPAKCVSLSAQTITLPPSPCARPSAASTTPAATLVLRALRMAGLLPCRSPPTRMVPPPESPETSTPDPTSR